MGQKLIDTWAGHLVKQNFTWGANDCHQLLLQFVRLCNPNWTDPHKVGRFTGTYHTWREANKIAKSLNISEVLTELDYERRPVNKVNGGDIVWMPSKSRAWDIYMPVIFGETVLCGDPKTKVIRMRHIREFDRYFEVYRRKECQQ